MAINCKMWLLAVVLVVIVDLHHGPRGNGVLCGKARHVQTKDDNKSSAASDESEDEESGGVSDDERSVDEDKIYHDPKRREKSKSKSVDSDEKAADDRSGDDNSDAQSDEEEDYVKSKSKSKRGVQSRFNRKDKNHGGDDNDDEDKDSDEPKSGKSKLKARTSKNKVEDDENDVDEDGDNGRRRKKRNRKKGSFTGEGNFRDNDDETKLESSTVIVSGDVDEVLKYINGEMISFQPNPLDFTKKQSKKLKSDVEKVLIKKKSGKPEAKITVLIQNNFHKATSSKKVLKDAKKEKFFLDSMKKVLELYYNELKERRTRLD